jgi:hypothetical protein
MMVNEYISGQAGHGGEQIHIWNMMYMMVNRYISGT